MTFVTEIFDDMVALFAEEATLARVVFGGREPTKQTNQGPGRAARVCFVPKDGAIGPVHLPGRNPKPLMTHVERFDIYVWGFDASAPNDESKQYKATVALLHAVLRSIRLSSTRAVASDVKPVGDVIERRFGHEVVFTLSGPNDVLDTPYATAPDDTAADAVVTMTLPSGNVDPDTGFPV